MKTLPILTALFLASSFAFADGCPNLAGKFVQENAGITIAQGEDAGVPFYSFSTPNESGSEDVTTFIVDGKEHGAVSEDSRETYSASCADGKLALRQIGSAINDFHNSDGDDSQLPAVSPDMPVFLQELLRMMHEAIKNKQSLEVSYDNTTEFSLANRDIQVKVVGNTTIKNLDTKEVKEVPLEDSAVMKRDEN